MHKGKFERFIHDEKELNAFLLSKVAGDVVVRTHAGEELSGKALQKLLDQITFLRDRRKDAANMGIEEPLFNALMQSPTRLKFRYFEENDPVVFAADMAPRGYEVWLDKEHDEESEKDRYFLVFENKNGHRTRLGMEFFNSKLYRNSYDTYAALSQQCGGFDFTMSKDGVESEVSGMFALLELVLGEAHKGWQIQRYKGLGEMNPEQLWETTMNPEKRTLLQVRIQDATEANDIFMDLMGDNVEPRREFIEKNALAVQELDI